jgi:hypothetical protein
MSAKRNGDIMLDDHEVNKIRALLLEIMMCPNWVDEYENYEWNPKYQQHTTLAGVLHYRRMIKYGVNGNKVFPNFVITERGRKWLDEHK